VHSTTFRLKKDAEAYLNKVLRELNLGVFFEPIREPVNDFLDRYLESKKLEVRARSHDSYAEVLRLYIRPDLGDIPVCELSTEIIEQAYDGLLAPGISSRTVRYAHSILSAALRQAVERSQLLRNPAQFAKLPRVPKREGRWLTSEQAAGFLAAAEGDPWKAFFLTALDTGCRPPEVLALMWRDVDLDRATAVVQRSLYRRKGARAFEFTEPKTQSSRRNIALAPSTVTALREHRKDQNLQRLAAGSEYEAHQLVFAGPTGRPPQYRNLIRHHFKPLLAKAGLPSSTRLYDLRHSCASLLLEVGENTKVIALRLGHASIRTTLNTYGHLGPNMQQEAATKLERLLYGGRAK
jgi:integrase